MMYMEVVVAVITFLFVYFILNRKTNCSLPGPIHWPMIGNLMEISLSDKTYHIALKKMALKYGEIMSLKMGVHNIVIVSSYNAMKDILGNLTISGRYEFPFVRDRAFGHRKIGIIWNYGKDWQDMRNFTLRGLKKFGYGKPEVMDLIFQEELVDMLSYITKEVKRNNGIWNLDTYDIAASVVSNLWIIVGGHKLPKGDSAISKFIELSSKQIQVLGPANLYNPFPILRKLFPKLVKHDEHMQIHHELQRYMMEIMENIKRNRENRSNKAAQNFVELFLDEIEKTKSDPASQFTEMQLIMVLIDLFLGGADTTAEGIKWIVLHLTINPHVQQKVQQEISKVISNKEGVSVRDSVRMPYTKAVILEVLRSSVLVPVLSFREAVKDFHYNGQMIPKGFGVTANLYNIAQDAEFWGDPQVFRPERFLNESEIELKIAERERTSSMFGFGKRKCIGSQLAMDTLFVYTVTLLRQFTFTKVHGDNLSADNPIHGFTTSPQPFRVNVHTK